MPKSPSWALMTVMLAPGHESLDEAAHSLEVPPSALDEGFGVVPVDRERGLYAVQMDSAFVTPGPKGDYGGPFSDPRIGSLSMNRKK